MSSAYHPLPPFWPLVLSADPLLGTQKAPSRRALLLVLTPALSFSGTSLDAALCPNPPPCLVLPNPSHDVSIRDSHCGPGSEPEHEFGFPTQDQVAGAAGWTIGVTKSRKLVDNSEHFAATMGEVSTPAGPVISAWGLPSLASVGFEARCRGMKVADVASMMGGLAFAAPQSWRPCMSSDLFHSIAKNVFVPVEYSMAWRRGNLRFGKSSRH
jgi:hypothetical protein